MNFFFDILLISLLQLTTGKHLEYPERGITINKIIRSNRNKKKIFVRKKHPGNPNQYGQLKANKIVK